MMESLVSVTPELCTVKFVPFLVELRELKCLDMVAGSCSGNGSKQLINFQSEAWHL